MELAKRGGTSDEMKIYATHLKEHRTAQKGALPRFIGRTKDDLNSKLHTICDGEGRPRCLFFSAGQVSDYTDAAALLSSLPPNKILLADLGYDADWLHDALADRKIVAWIPLK